MDLVLMCCKLYHRNILLQLLMQLVQICRRRRRPYEGKSTSDLSKSRYVKNHLANRQIEIHMRRRSWGVPVPTDSCISNDCNGRFTTLRSYVTTCGHVGSGELWNLLDHTGATYYDACVVWGHSPVDIHKLSSWKVVHQCKHVNTHWWTTFQLLSLWLSMSTGLWLQTTHAPS